MLFFFFFDGWQDGANLGEISKGLVVRCGDPEPTKSTASWALANCCDTLSDS